MNQVPEKYPSRRRPVLLLALALLLVLPLATRESDYSGHRIEAIEFLGLSNLKPGDLSSYLLMQKGDVFAPEALNRDLKSLFGSGYFESAQVRLQVVGDKEIRIYYVVRELPRIAEVQFLGAEELYPQDLKNAAGIKEGDVYSEQKARSAVDRLKKKYREEGFFLADVWVQIAPAPENNRLTIRYIIDEGENIPVAKINIMGLRRLDPDEIFDTLQQKEEGTFDSGKFEESKYQEDQQKIVGFAKMRGYVDARIDEKKTGYEIRWRNRSKPEEGRVVVITYALEEGEIAYFGGYSLEHDPDHLNVEENPPEKKELLSRGSKQVGPLAPVYKADDLLRVFEFNDTELGAVFDESKYFRDRAVIQELYSRRGYVFTQVQPVITRYRLTEEEISRIEGCRAGQGDAECKRMAANVDPARLRELLKEHPEKKGQQFRYIHFIVRENGLAYIENIVVKGIVKTQERVVRRNLLIREGQLFNSALVNRSREKLIGLGYFKEVNFQMRPGSDDEKMNLIIDLVEQPTGTISMGGGYGTQSGFSIFTEVGENNLAGTGQRISGRLEYGPLRRTIQIRWTEPWMYERCELTTGSYWRNKQKLFDSALNVDDVMAIAEGLQHDHAERGKIIKGYALQTRENSIEALDTLKVQIRNLLKDVVGKEEDCFRSAPSPWSLTLSAFYVSQSIIAPTIQISDDPADLVEDSQYEKNRIGIGVGVSHSFLINWAHYHRYSPSWSIASRPTALVADSVLREVDLGYQFKSSLTHGLVYDTRDNPFTPTQGMNLDLSLETVGQVLGGDDHFNRYGISWSQYWWWFDYTLGGLFRKNSLTRWRVVQEFRFSSTFTHETGPYGKKQDKEKNPYIEPDDRLYLGGYESLRGYNINDAQFPRPWRSGGSHQILFNTELRFPIEPSILWLAFFLDAGSLFINTEELTGAEKEYVDNYADNTNLVAARSQPLEYIFFENYNPLTFQRRPYPVTAWNDPDRAALRERNVALDRFLFSWGAGFRIQIPVLPLRFFFAQKVYYAGGGRFKPIPGDDKFNFVFGIGDFRF
ncbi:MAG: BamA/TamA family outer membrane protein [Spirochaetales bacterium]|nr:BamA/TamA family outer membrane protein [Spirochaetales bacterium]